MRSFASGKSTTSPAASRTAAPCGHCRQFMNELSPDGQIGILVDQAAPMKLSALLPMAFGPKDLGRKEGAFPIKPMKLIPAAPPSDALIQAALEAARTSYAPYSGANSGAAISTRSGGVYKGSYIENVAFNPSLSPLQTALVQLIDRIVGRVHRSAGAAHRDQRDRIKAALRERPR